MKKQDEYIVSTSKNVILASSRSSEVGSMLVILYQGMMEDVFPKQPRAGQYILSPARSLGCDPLTFATNRSKFLIHGK